MTGLSPENALTFSRLGIDLGLIKTMGDLQSGIEAGPGNWTMETRTGGTRLDGA